MSAKSEPTFCPVCCTSHSESDECPGPLLATGPERHAWRKSYNTPYGVESCGVLIAPAGRFWRARVLTYPNVLWTIPGGAASLKFAALAPQDAENAAIAFITRHYAARRCEALGGEPDEVAVRPFSEEGSDSHDSTPPRDRRELAYLPVKWGSDEPTEKTVSRDLSEGGMFVVTAAPAGPGTSLQLLVTLAGRDVLVKGKVVWNRETSEPGRPAGMGIRLVLPPDDYVRFVRELR